MNDWRGQLFTRINITLPSVLMTTRFMGVSNDSYQSKQQKKKMEGAIINL